MADRLSGVRWSFASLPSQSPCLPQGSFEVSDSNEVSKSQPSSQDRGSDKFHVLVFQKRGFLAENHFSYWEKPNFSVNGRCYFRRSNSIFQKS